MSRKNQIEESYRIYKNRILKVESFIQQNLGSELRLSTLARIANFSPFHFHRIFKAITGEAIMAYVKRLRLEQAALKILTTNQSIELTSLEVGYKSLSSFSKAFKSHFGHTPKRYRAYRRGMLSSASSQIGFFPNSALANSENDISNAVRVETITSIRVVYIRHTGPYHQVDAVWTKLLAQLSMNRLPTENQWAISYDHPSVTPIEKLRYDACVECDQSFTYPERLPIQTIGGGRFATLVHNGLHQSLGRTFLQVYGCWLPYSGFQPKNAPPLLQLLSRIDVPTNNSKIKVCVPVEPL